MWSWTCGDEDLTMNSTTKGNSSLLSFTANRRHDEQLCYCRAKTQNSLNQTYNKKSGYAKIFVTYAPSTFPKLNISNLRLYQGEEATLGCSIESLGNIPITWSWTCGSQYIYNRLQTNGRTTSIVITAEPNLNGHSCYCTASGSNVFTIVSEEAQIFVYYNPPDSPQINSYGTKIVNFGSEVNLQCSLSTTGNPPITWSWYCNGVIVTEGVLSHEKSTELTFVADVTDDKKECYCRARGSWSISGVLYDKKSLVTRIRVHVSVRNREITWSWTCGGQHVNKRLQTNRRTTSVVITGEPILNGQSCYCTAAASINRFQIASEAALIHVYYNPIDYPRISSNFITANVGSLVNLQCSLSSTGNPPIIWLWYCNDVMVTEGVRNQEKTTELSFVADVTDDKMKCFCRAQGSRSISGMIYDKNSSITHVKVSGTQRVEQSDRGSNGISKVVFWVILTILLLALASCSVIIFVQHRKIPKESSPQSWIMKKIGKKSRQICEPHKSLNTCEEHKYEELEEGIPIREIDQMLDE